MKTQLLTQSTQSIQSIQSIQLTQLTQLTQWSLRKHQLSPSKPTPKFMEATGPCTCRVAQESL